MICQRKGCGHSATHAPKLCVPAFPGRPGGRAAISPVLTLLCCADCIISIGAADFIGPGDPARENLRAAIALQAGGRFLPDFEQAWIEPVDLTSEEWAQVERARGRWAS